MCVMSACAQGVIRTFSINDEPIGRSIDETFRQLEVRPRLHYRLLTLCPGAY